MSAIPATLRHNPQDKIARLEVSGWRLVEDGRANVIKKD
jgi:hypothetical protein